MGNKKDILPIVMASAIALVITGVVRWMMPGGTVIKQQPLKKELSLPDIPLMIKSEQKKTKEIQVLVTNTTIKKDERIVQGKLTWKIWPANAVQPHFIAQDNKGTPLNNRTDYANALNMWAKSEIPEGIPLTLSMLTSNDPVEVARKQKEAEEAKKRKQKEKEKKEDTSIKVGYRAVTFQIDQRIPIPSSMISPGDYVDVRISSFEGGKQNTHVYKGLRIIAIDGRMKKQASEQENNNNSGGLFGTGISLGGMSSPKNVTLEVKERMVDIMMKQAASNGITVMVRSQNEKIEETEMEEQMGEEQSYSSDSSSNSSSDNSLIRGILEMRMNRSSSADILRETAKKRSEEENNISVLLRNMNNLSMRSSATKSGDSGTGLPSGDSSKYEITSGSVGQDSTNKKKDDKKTMRIYRKLVEKQEQFDKDGKKSSGESMSSSMNQGMM